MIARLYGSWLAVTSAAGSAFGSLLIAKPNSSELDQRHAEHHREGDAVAPHLDELLGQQRAEPAQRERRPHAMLSCEPAMNWMKTSSRLVSAGATVDARRRARPRPAPPRAPPRSRPTTCSDSAEGRDLVDAGRAAQAAGERLEAGPGDDEGVQARPRDHLGDGALGDQPAVGDVADAVAALGLVHVVGRDQHGDAVGGELVDLVPELAPRLRVDAGGRLVEQQELRLVHDAGGERQPLLPAAGELAGELLRGAMVRPRRGERVARPRARGSGRR